MSEKSSFRNLLEMSDKIAREELGDYYIMGASRMDNLLYCLEDGATQISGLTCQRDALKQVVSEREERIAKLEAALQYYAQPETYYIDFQNMAGLPVVCIDNGEIAKAALEI